jgi:hypothetical protein
MSCRFMMGCYEAIFRDVGMHFTKSTVGFTMTNVLNERIGKSYLGVVRERHVSSRCPLTLLFCSTDNCRLYISNITLCFCSPRRVPLCPQSVFHRQLNSAAVKRRKRLLKRGMLKVK